MKNRTEIEIRQVRILIETSASGKVPQVSSDRLLADFTRRHLVSLHASLQTNRVTISWVV